MLKRTIITLILSLFLVPTPNIAFSAEDDTGFTKLTTVDLNTFNEYRYRITEQFFELRSKFEIEGSVDKDIALKILDIAKQGYNYLPDNLTNKNVYNKIKTSIERGVKYPDNEGNYTAIISDIQAYLENMQIEKITGKVEAFPDTGNAPLTVTFRGNVKDPTGTKIPTHNYIWWMDVGGKRKILSNSKWPSLHYTFKEEWNFSVFLDVVSNHKNAGGYTDVLPFRSRADIKVKEKVASVIIKVNGLSLRQKDELKFTPEEANYVLLFDATSSTPTSGSKFLKTEWEFGNGIKKEYTWAPNIERIVYNGEWEYRVKLKLRTNEWKTTERIFDIVVHDPIATIKSNLEEWFLGDKFTFSAENQINDDNLTYYWEVIDIEQDEIIFRKTGSLFTYAFTKKWKYNLRLIVREPSSNIPDIDTLIIHINSRAPEAYFKSTIPLKSKPNMVLLDATKSFDQDFSDEGKLKFSWVINGQRVQLDNANYNWSTWYYTFDSIWDHSVVLEVTDPDGITVQKKDKVRVDSILSVEFFAFPRVIQREQIIDFNAYSPEAKFYEWDFGDGEIKWWREEEISHVYKESWVFPVTLKVVDEDDRTNTFTKNVYVWESDSPYAFITLKNPSNSELLFRNDSCEWNGAYIIDRVDSIKFSWEESIDITGKSNGLSYSWKLDGDTFYSSSTFRKKFDELGCFPVQLKVKSNKNGRTSTRSIWVKVENLKPTLSAIDVKVIDNSSDPVIVKVNALGAQDKDGVIQSYLWYYYTDLDSEPQDFRATKDAETTFVLPKITGNYYFVVLMKDNNEARITSEEITGSKYFITLAWNNINTPLIQLTSNKKSVTIGEEIIFYASAENILWQDISKKAKYSWDLDGDGFYEKETSSPTTSYKFVYSWEVHSKVKVKYKWFSSTKSITIGVANILKPDFSYISIGNQFIFLDKSTGRHDTIQWNLWDGAEVSKKDAFIHQYSDNESSHFVELEIGEWSKVRTVRKKVIKNLKNFILSRKQDLVIFSDPLIEENKITLEQVENVYLFLKSNSGATKSYEFDFDIEKDSDLNGGVDDDIDLSGSFSGTSSEVITIPLSKQKSQNVRITTKNGSWSTIESYDFEIEKLYIDEEIDIKSIKFNGISDSERVKIEKLKDYVNSLPKEHKLKALMYVQKLQEEWFDNREKTNVILEFENYVSEVDPGGAEYAITLLESLLVEWQEDQSEKSIIFNALKNLIPQTISCEWSEEELGEQSCYDSLIAKLEVIKENSSIDENRTLWTQILKIVAVDKTMTNKQKTDFKAILKTFVYGWVQNIPEEEKQEVIEENTWGADVLGLIKTIFLWLFIILWVFILISLVYYIYYRLVNKNPNIWFQDFIIEKTSWRKSKQEKPIIAEDEDIKDILWSMNEEEGISVEPEKASESVAEKIVEDSSSEQVFEPESKPEQKKEEKIEKVATEEQKAEFAKEEVPDWLKGSFSEDSITETPSDIKVEEVKKSSTAADTINEEKKVEEKQEIPSTKSKPSEKGSTEDDDANVPDWLKGSFTKEEEKPEVVENDNKNKASDTSIDSQETSNNIAKEQKKEERVQEVEQPETQKEDRIEETPKEDISGLPKNEDLDEITKVEDDNTSGKDIPDWLKWSFSKEDEKTEVVSNDDTTKEDSAPKEEITKQNDKIPDWLKTSFWGDEKQENENKNGKKEEVKKEQAINVPKEDTDKKMPLKESPAKEVKKDVEKKETGKEEPKNEVKKEIIKKEEKKEEKKQEIPKNKWKEDGKKKKENTNKSINKDDKKEPLKKEEKKQEANKQENNKKNKDSDNKPSNKPQHKNTKSSEDSEKQEQKPKTNQKPIEKKKDTWTDTKPREQKKENTKTTQDNTSQETPKSDSDLWDDGMKIPDWLKTDSDK